MLKPSSAILVLTLIAAALSARAGSQSGLPVEQAVVHGASSFHVSRPGDKGCTVELEDTGSVATGHCAMLYPELAGIAGWVETGSGAIRLIDAQGARVIVFAASDGPAFEAVEPRNSLLRLEPAI